MACQIGERNVAVPLPARLCLSFLQQISSKPCSHDDAPCREVANVNPCDGPDSAAKLPVLLGSRSNHSVHFTSFDDSPFATPKKAGSFERLTSELSSDRSTSIDCDDPTCSSSSSWKLGVKNTFVHVTDDSDSDNALPVVRSKSEAPRSSLQSSGSQAVAREEFLASAPDSRSKLPSVGSAEHGSGSCKPCAWFWKPEGCANGADCRHCHLCPFAEIQRRRKATAVSRRSRKVVRPSAPSADSVVGPPEVVGRKDRSISESSSDSSISTIADSVASSHSTSSREIEVKNTFIHFSDSSDEEMIFTRCKTEPKHLALHPIVPQIQSCADLPTPSLPECQSQLPSLGSAVHGTGTCKPCAWFWKVEGCANGADCRHCHLCSQDEIKRRRKTMNSTRRRKAISQSESQSLGQD